MNEFYRAILGLILIAFGTVGTLALFLLIVDARTR